MYERPKLIILFHCLVIVKLQVRVYFSLLSDHDLHLEPNPVLKLKLVFTLPESVKEFQINHLVCGVADVATDDLMLDFGSDGLELL